MSPTLHDVARKAAVSSATASRALRGLPNVAPATRARVLQVAKDLHYAITPQASRVLTGNKVIAVLTPLVDQWFFNKVATAAVLELQAAGFDAARYSADSDEAQTRLINRLLNQQLIDGVICVSFTLEDDAVFRLEQQAIPAVTIESDTGVFPSITLDNRAAAELATRHLVNLGHKRIGHISTSEVFTQQGRIPKARKAGYQRALTAAGIPFDPQLLLSGNDVYEGGAVAMQQLLTIEDPPTAVFAASDEMAIGALYSARRFGLRVPEDISVIGFDDNDIAEYLGLTTLRQPVNRYGELAAEVMLNALSDEGKEITGLEPPFELVVRATTAPARPRFRLNKGPC